jgi:hypothetical protein
MQVFSPDLAAPKTLYYSANETHPLSKTYAPWLMT